MADLVFLDIETTGLDPDRHHVWEIAYANERGPVKCFQVEHTTTGADPVALRINGWADRVKPEYVDRDRDYDVVTFEGASRLHGMELRLLIEALRGNHVVASNPSFDTAFLRKLIGHEPWHHRKIDIGSLAMGILNWDRPRGLADIAKYFAITPPDHTAAGDVHTLRPCYRRLMLTGGE